MAEWQIHGPVDVTLVSIYSFLTHEKQSNALTVTVVEEDAIGTYLDAYLVFEMSEATL